MLFIRGFFLLATLFLTACANQVLVSSDAAVGTNFSQYKTYRWHDAGNKNLSSDEFLTSDFVDGRVRAAVDEQLQMKGYHYQETGPVDLLVSYTIDSEKRQCLYGYSRLPTWGISAFDRRNHFGYGVGLSRSTRIQTEFFQQASLVLDFVSGNDKLLIWRGKAERRLPAEQNPDQWRKGMRKAIDSLLGEFYSHNKIETS